MPTNDSAAELANMVAPEYRYPDNDTVPQWARGKSAGDMLQLMQGLVESVGRGAAQGGAPSPAPLPPAGDDEYITAAHLRQAQQQALAQVSPWLQSVADQQATMSYNVSKDRHLDLFKKYEPEIIGVLQRVPRANWTLDVIENAVKFVKGNHVDELVADRQRQLEATMASTMRSTGRAGLSPGSPLQATAGERLEKTPDEWRSHARAVGITEQQVHEFCFANDITPEEFFKQFDKGIVTDAVADVSFKRGMTG